MFFHAVFEGKDRYSVCFRKDAVNRMLTLLVKLTRYGQGILCPNFERMQSKIDEWTRFSNTGFFAYNRSGGKLMYYLLLFYVTCLSLFILLFMIYSLAR